MGASPRRHSKKRPRLGKRSPRKKSKRMKMKTSCLKWIRIQSNLFAKGNDHLLQHFIRIATIFLGLAFVDGDDSKSLFLKCQKIMKNLQFPNWLSSKGASCVLTENVNRVKAGFPVFLPEKLYHRALNVLHQDY